MHKICNLIIMNYRFFFLFIVNILCVLAYPQELKLSFSEPFNSVGLESISCIPIEDKIVHVQQKSKEEFCALTFNVFDVQLKKRDTFQLIEPRYKFLTVKYFFDEIFVFASLMKIIIRFIYTNLIYKQVFII